MSTVLVYSDDASFRERVRVAIGRQPSADGVQAERVDYVELDTEPNVILHVDKGGIDVCVFEGDAWPAGGMGISRQLKNEIKDCPAIVVVVARPADAWLGTWSQADVVLHEPMDPRELSEAVARLLIARSRRLEGSTPALLEQH